MGHCCDICFSRSFLDRFPSNASVTLCWLSCVSRGRTVTNYFIDFQFFIDGVIHRRIENINHKTEQRTWYMEVTRQEVFHKSKVIKTSYHCAKASFLVQCLLFQKLTCNTMCAPCSSKVAKSRWILNANVCIVAWHFFHCSHCWTEVSQISKSPSVFSVKDTA